MQPLLIAPYQVGVQKNLEPFMIPDDAFPDMLNAFVWRGRVQRKAGYQLLGRLRRVVSSFSLPVTDGAGFSSGNLLTALQIIAPNATLQTSSLSIVVDALGVPETYTETVPLNGTLTGSLGGSGTINYITGAITIQTAPAVVGKTVTASFAYFPNLPAMGIRTYEDPNLENQEKTIFFDTVYAYRYVSDFEELPSTVPSTWSGTDSQQFWGVNYQTLANGSPLFWVTNDKATNHGYVVTTFGGSVAGPPSTSNVTTQTANNFLVNDQVVFFQMTGGVANATIATVTVAGNPFTVTNPGTGVFTNGAFSGMVHKLSDQDGIRYYDGTTWNYFTPPTNTGGTTFVVGARMIVPYKNRLVLLGTIEWDGTQVRSFNQRARACWLGSATNIASGWKTDDGGLGFVVDASTDEQIISCGFVKDELIVYFERSSWKLVYTGNEAGPFTWQRINAELGAESTFSDVQFDDGLLALGNVGIHKCNGSQVARIDQLIPDVVFEMHNGGDGPKRVSAIRDWLQEIVYFAYVDIPDNTPDVLKTKFPNKMIIYNYRNNTFSFTDDHATTFGYFQPIDDTPWNKLTTFPWSAWNIAWNAGILQSGFAAVHFGNQQGFIETVNPEIISQDSSLYVKAAAADVITSPEHGLSNDEYIIISGSVGTAGAVLPVGTYKVGPVVDRNSFKVIYYATPSSNPTIPAFSGYIGGGLIERVSNVSIPTKAFTPLWEKGKNYTLTSMEVLVDRTAEGEFHIDIFTDLNTSVSMTDNTSGARLGTATISTAPEGSNLPYYPMQQQATQIWKRFYTDATGETFQIKFSFSEEQLRDYAINNSDVVVHAMLFFFQEAGEFY